MKRLAMALGLAVLMGVCGVAEARRTGGVGRDATTLPGLSKSTYHVTFNGGELAVVTIVGSGNTDLDIFVYDEFGNRVAFGDGPTDIESVSWTPRWTGRFRIEVHNLGSYSNFYTLRTN
jgi:hypothetical protein